MNDTTFFATWEQRKTYPKFFIDSVLGGWMTRGDMGLKSTMDYWIKLVQMLFAHGKLPNGQSTILSPQSVNEIGNPSPNLPSPNATLVSPHTLNSAPLIPQPCFGIKPTTTTDVVYRSGNSFQGQVPGIELNVVLDPCATGPDPYADDTCCWMGIASVYLSYNVETGVECIVMGQEVDYFESMEVLRWIMGVACELVLGDRTDRYFIIGGGE